MYNLLCFGMIFGFAIENYAKTLRLLFYHPGLKPGAKNISPLSGLIIPLCAGLVIMDVSCV